MALPPDAAAYNSMREESLVNGVWYHILSQAFQFPKYIIAPEYWTDDRRLRGDLFVIRVDPNDPDKNKAVFAFEGKRQGNVAEFQAARTQLWGYLKNITQGGTRGYSFGVVAAGKKYAIVQNDGSIQRRLEPIPEGLGVTSGLAKTSQFGNISKDGEYESVLEILRSIEAWINTHIS